MKILFFVFLIMLFIVALNHPRTLSSSSHSAQPPSPAFVVHLSETQPPSSPQTPSSNQLNKIIDALNGTGEFTAWANILSSTDPSTLSFTATFFIPIDDAVAKTENATGILLPDSFLIPYHIIVPQRLTFSELRKYPVSARLPTLLPKKFIIVTNNSVENFTVDGTRITHPDLYLTSSFSVHGLMSVLDYELFKNGVEIGNGTSTKNETKNEEKEKAKKGADVSFGDGSSRNFWINVAAICVVLVYLMGIEFTFVYAVLVYVLSLDHSFDPDFLFVLLIVAMMVYFSVIS